MRFFFKNRMIGIVAALALVLVLNFSSGQVRGFFLGVFSPIQGFFWDAGQVSSRFFSGLFKGVFWERENTIAQERMLGLQQDLIVLQDVQKENESLRKALGLGLEKKFNIISARIVGKDPSQDILILSAGSRDGVQRGMSVITPENVAVGKIEEVFEGFSQVMLLSHPASSFEGKILTEGVVGAVQGKGSYQAFLDLIPQESKVAPGDIVVSASLGGTFPENLLIGEVREVRASEEKTFQQASLSLFFDVPRAGLLLIIERQ